MLYPAWILQGGYGVAKFTFKNSELIQRFKKVDTLPEEEQVVIIKSIPIMLGNRRLNG